MKHFILMALLLFSSVALSATKFVYPITLVSAGDMSANVTSSSLDIMTVDNISVHFVWTGTPTGTLNIDLSNDNTNWSSPTLTPAPAPAGGASNALVDLNQTGARYIRVRYTRTSGTGTLVVKVGEKGI